MMEIRDKCIFFDVDGVLSAPAYFDEEKKEFVIAFSDEKWLEYLDNEGAYAYKYCRPIPQVQTFIKQLQANDNYLLVLSTVANNNEIEAKKLFINNYYPATFNDLIFVEHDKDKITKIQKIALRNNLDYEDIVLVEDSYNILIEARTLGINCIHLSNILADNIFK